MIAATSLLTSLTILAPFLKILSSNKMSGLFIHPVIDTPNNASLSNISFDIGCINLKSVYPACKVPSIAAALHAL